MNRSKRIAFVAHCLLNSNSKVIGYAEESGAIVRVIQPYIDAGVGIIQLPCPEMTFLGLERWGMTYNQYDTPAYRRHCHKLLIPIVDQIQMYAENGYCIEAILGIEGSPSCGVTFTFTGYTGGRMNSLFGSCEQASTCLASSKISAKGVFIDELEQLLLQRKITIPITGIEE